MDSVLKSTGSSEEEAKLKKDIATLYNDLTDEWGNLCCDGHVHHGFYNPKDSYTENDHKIAQVRMVEEALKFAQITDDNKPKNILDIGCGLGSGTIHLANKFEAKACGIDLSPVQIQKAQEIAKAYGIDDKVSFQVADASSQPFPDGQFDLVWSMESAELIPNKLKLVSEMARVAAPGATIIITSGFHRELLPDEGTLKLDEKVLLDKICSEFCLPEFCSASDFVKIAQSFGLQEIKTADWTDNVAAFWPTISVKTSNAVGETIVMDAEATSNLRKENVDTTDDSYKFTWHTDHKTVVKAIYNGSSFIDTAVSGSDVGIVLESTSFYAEQGGQIYDTGLLDGSFGSFEVSNVQVYGGYVLHIGSFSAGTSNLSVGDKVVCKVDYGRRALIAPNHTCTHMLNFALREILGDHVDQKGSIVLPEKLRFDFSHGKPISPENLRKIEDIVNKQIKEELDVFAKEADLNAAKRVNGLRAVFGETYPNPVRIVSIGRKVEDLLIDPDNKEWLSYSTELCGGTHISNTREAKAFALLSEEGIAKGIRRVTAVTTNCAINANVLADSFDAEISDASKAEGSELEKKIASLKNRTDAAAIPAARKAELRAKISKLQAQLIEEKKRLKEENIQKVINVATETAEAAASEGKAFCVIRLDVSADVAAVQQKAVLKVKDQKGLAVMVISIDESSNKAHVCAGVPTNKSKDGFEVLEWLKASMGPIKGRGGGGKNGIAQGQGTDISGIEEAMDLASNFAAMKLR